MFGAADVYANSSFLFLSFCPPPCQVVGADAVATARSPEALVDAVKCSGGINTSEGRTEDRWRGHRWGSGRSERRITAGQRGEQGEEGGAGGESARMEEPFREG